MMYRYIAIEGNIGAGKTSLAELLASDLKAQFIPERFNENVFLPRFYVEPDRYALPLELSFLLDRNDQLNQLQRNDPEEIVIADYTIDKCLVFASANLPEDEFSLFRSIFMQYAADLRRPDLILFLCQDAEKLQANIRKRDRNYESGISDDYLEKISQSYVSWLSGIKDIPVLLIDAVKLDFMASTNDYLKIKGLIQQTWQPGHHFLKF